MSQKIREVMTPNPRTVPASATLVLAARIMRDEDVGDVLVEQDGTLAGIVTDRDLVVRAVADGRDPSEVRAGDIASRDVVTVSPDDSVGDAVRLMREGAIRRLPVVENGRPVGVVSIGDLAIESDGESALASISASPPNN